MCDVKLLNFGLLWVLMTETKAHYRKPSQTELLHEYYVRNYNIGVHYPFLIKFVVQKFLTDTILKIKNCFGDVLFVKVSPFIWYPTWYWQFTLIWIPFFMKIKIKIIAHILLIWKTSFWSVRRQRSVLSLQSLIVSSKWFLFYLFGNEIHQK